VITKRSLRTPTNLQFSCFFFSSILSSWHCRSWYSLFMKTQHPSGCCERKLTNSELNEECACITWRLVEQFKNVLLCMHVYKLTTVIYCVFAQFSIKVFRNMRLYNPSSLITSNSQLNYFWLISTEMCCIDVLAKSLKCTMQEKLEWSYYFIQH